MIFEYNLGKVIGPNGKSAYEIAVDNGFEGTEQEWLESLNGNRAGTIVGSFSYNGDSLVPYLKQETYVSPVLIPGLPRSKQIVTMAAVDNEIYIFSATQIGWNIWKINTDSGVLEDLSVAMPSGIVPINAVSVEKQIYMFAPENAFSGLYTNEILKFDTETKTVTTLTEVLPRVIVGASVVAVGKYIYLFGGLQEEEAYTLDDILRFNTETRTIETLSEKLPDGGLAVAGITAVGNHIYLFGGYSGGSTYALTDKILKFDIETQKITELSEVLPSKRGRTSAVADREHIFIFGGFEGVWPNMSMLDEILKFDIKTEKTAPLSVTLRGQTMAPSSVAIGSDIYIISDTNDTNQKEIQRFSANADVKAYTFLSRIAEGQKLTASETVYLDDNEGEINIIDASNEFYVAEKDGVILGKIGASVSGYIINNE